MVAALSDLQKRAEFMLKDHSQKITIDLLVRNLILITSMFTPTGVALAGLPSAFDSPAIAVLDNTANEDTLAGKECVILLHGLGRSSSSMRPVANLLSRHGYAVVNKNYPSREHDIATLATNSLNDTVAQCKQASVIHLVTHSLGGVLVRQYFKEHHLERLANVVMLGPPNQGSEIVDAYEGWPGVAKFGGPAFLALSPSSVQGVANTLGPVNFSVGVIAGNKSVNPILSIVLPGTDDGKVTIENTRVEGMADHRVVATSHPFMMRNAEVHRNILCFLQTARFCDSFS